MAFCNSCGATVTDGTRFCNKCGSAIPAGPSTPGTTATAYAAPPPSKGGSSALKIILLIIAVIVGIGLLAMVTCGIVIHRIAKSAHVSQNGDNVKVETPFGSMETNKDPAQTAKDLGVEIYPGAVPQKNGTASMSFGNMKTVTASFVSSDSVDKVCDFYKAKFPSSTMTTSDQNHCTIMSGDQQNMITITAQSNGGTTKLVIANVNKKAN
jgi:CRISPR/Cas system CMR subunit Cmr4 (Cas7 group RAMP superfamily)